ncbi:MAG: ABC transporter permease [Gemmatimonadetes bacterium]|nr:ABC transporter permease [Gemmatimonadota bacterium]
MTGLVDLLFRLLVKVLPGSVGPGLVGDLAELFHERRTKEGTLRAAAWLASQMTGTLGRFALRGIRAWIRGAENARKEGRMGLVAGRGWLRQFYRAPSYSALVIAMVSIGIGVVATVFALVEGVILRPMPYPEPERIVSVSEDNPLIAISPGWTSIPNYLDWRDRAASFESMAMFRGRSVSVGTDGAPAYAYGALVTEDFFDVFGISPALGRGFSVSEVQGSGSDVVVLSDELWRSGYGADPDILGRDVLIDGRPHTVIGVMPPGYNAPGEWAGATTRVALWRPFPIRAGDARENRSYSVAARLTAGASLASARQDVGGVHERLTEAFPEANGGWVAQVIPWRKLIVGPLETPLFLLLAAMGLVLLTACANVASLAAARILARTREMSTRVALGASRGAVVVQVMGELMVLMTVGAVFGLLGSALALDGLRALDIGFIPRLAGVGVNAWVVGLAGATAGLAGLAVAGGTAGLTLRGHAAGHLRQIDVGASRLGLRVRSSLTVLQITLSFVLLTGAILLLTSFRSLIRTNLGFDPENTLAMTVALSWDRVDRLADRTAFTTALLSELDGIPGVEGAAMINSLPLSGSRQINRVAIEGLTDAGREPAMAIRGVSPSYHGVFRIPLVEGRLLDRTDVETPSVALINRRAAELNWPGVDPVGSQLRIGASEPLLTVVGVVGNVLHDGARGEVLPEVYVPYSLETLTSKSFVVRSALPAQQLVPHLRSALREVDPEQPIREIRPLTEWADRSVAPARFQTFLMSVGAIIAMLLAGTGLFAAVAHLVGMRRREIALRRALGAGRGSIRRLVVKRASSLVGPGILLGVVAAFAVSPLLRSLLYGVEPQSPAVLVAVTGTMVLLAALAILIPTLRAMAIEPARILREE